MSAPFGVAAGRRREGELADEMTPTSARPGACFEEVLPGVGVYCGQGISPGPGRLRGGRRTRLDHLQGHRATRSVPCLASGYSTWLAVVRCPGGREGRRRVQAPRLPTQAGVVLGDHLSTMPPI